MSSVFHAGSNSRSTAIVWLALLLIGPRVALAQDAATLVAQGNEAYQSTDYAKAAALWQQAIDAGAKNSAVPYNVACCHARLGNADLAFKALEQAIKAGYRDITHLRSDGDLESLRQDPRWSAVLQRCEQAEQAFAASIQAPDLRGELLRRMKEDQEARFALQDGEDMAKVHKLGQIDAANTTWIKGVMEQRGWLGKSLVGDDGALAAFLLVQHASHDLPFQERALELMKAAAEKGEASKAHLAYLTDRVLIARGKKQVYGTQFYQRGNQLGPQPIEDEANVDARRKELGLPSMAEYAKTMGTTYTPPTSAPAETP